MANITRRSPERDLFARGEFARDPFQIMNEMLGGFDPFRAEWGRGALPGVWTPQFEVKEAKDGYVIKADLPGVEEKDLDLSLVGTRLTISGHREAEERKEEENYFTFERSYGSFSRSFTLPAGVDAEEVDARLVSGVLTIHLPKKTEYQPKKISIKGMVDKVKGSLGGGKEKGSS